MKFDLIKLSLSRAPHIFQKIHGIENLHWFSKTSKFSAAGKISIKTSSSCGTSLGPQNPFPKVRVKAKMATAAVAETGIAQG